MKARSWLLAACLSAGLCAPVPAAAQGKPAGAAKGADASGKERAHAYLKTGTRAANAGEWDDAYAELSIAWKLHQDWEIAAALGRAAHRTQHHAEAVQRLSYYLREAPKDRVSAKQRADAEGWLRDARSKTGTLTITATTGADIQVDGELVGRAPLAEPLVLDVGKHTVEARYSDVQRSTVEVVAGSAEVLAFQVMSRPAATAPVAAPVMPASDGAWKRTAVLVGGGALAVGGLVAGGVSLGIAADKGAQKQEAAKDPEGRGAAQSLALAEADARNAALWSFVGGGLAAAGTTVFFFASRSAASSPVKGGVGVTPAGPSVWIQGQF